MNNERKLIESNDVEEALKIFEITGKLPRRKNIFYNSIANSLNDKFKYVLNDNELTEYAKCYSSIEYFANYLGIVLRDFQLNWIKLYQENKFTIYNVSRETGFINIFALLSLYDAVFHKKSTLMINHKKETSCEFLNIIKEFYLKLPYFLKSNVVSINSDKIQFLNCNITTWVSRNDLPNISAICMTYNNVYFMDYAYNPNAEKIYSSIMPMVSSNVDSKICIKSTFNGKNHFYQLYMDSIKKEGDPTKNVYKSIQTYWWEVKGRDLSWKENHIKVHGSEELFNRYYNLEL